jgi:hypothetical protein
MPLNCTQSFPSKSMVKETRRIIKANIKVRYLQNSESNLFSNSRMNCIVEQLTSPVKIIRFLPLYAYMGFISSVYRIYGLFLPVW